MTAENTAADPQAARDLALAAMVALRVDNIGDTCPAWLVGDERKCGKRPTVGSLCARHAKVAEKRLAERAEAQAAMAAAMADKRARLMPEKRARLAEVEAQLARHPLPADRAAYTGNVHPSIARRGHLTDTNVTRMAALHREADQLRAWLKETR